MEKASKSPISLKHQLPPSLQRILICNTQRDLSIDPQWIKDAVSFLLSTLKISTDEITIHFVTQKKIAQLHAEFFNDPTSTDCITFPIDPPTKAKGSYHVLGELFVCPKVASDYAREHGIAPSEELLRYVTHCILHLIGYTDLQPDERKKMKRKESLLVKKLRVHGFLD